MDSCPFCGDISSLIILQTETCFLTYADAPYYPDHLLVCPKRHVEHILELTKQEESEMESLQHKGLELLEKLGHKNITCMVREGMSTGKSVAHIHSHLIPEIPLSNEQYATLERQVLSQEQIIDLKQRISAVL